MTAATLLDRNATPPRKVESRSVPFRDVELRAAAGGKDLNFSGYACVTDVGYDVSDWLYGDYTEFVRQGAFAKTLADGADVPFKLNHDGMTLARTASKTMQLSEDDTGLYVEARFDPRNPDVQKIQSAMERGDMDEMSFAFWVTRQAWSPDWLQRDILEVNLSKGDVSLVNYGANPNTAGLTQLRARDAAGLLDRLTPTERRKVFDRLTAEFDAPKPAGRSVADAVAALAATKQ